MHMLSSWGIAPTRPLLLHMVHVPHHAITCLVSRRSALAMIVSAQGPPGSSLMHRARRDGRGGGSVGSIHVHQNFELVRRRRAQVSRTAVLVVMTAEMEAVTVTLVTYTPGLG